MAAMNSESSTTTLNDNNKTLRFLFDDKILDVPKIIWKDLGIVTTMEDLFSQNTDEPFVVKGFSEIYMRYLMVYMESGLMPSEAADLKELVVLAFYLQYKLKEVLCLCILELAVQEKEQGIDVLKMLHYEKQVEILECVFRVEDFNMKLDKIYQPQESWRASSLEFIMKKFIKIYIGSSEEVLQIANIYHNNGLSVLEIPKDLENYDSGKSIPDCVGHLLITGDVEKFMQNLDERHRNQLEVELRNLIFLNLCINQINSIPTFLDSKIKTGSNETAKRKVDRLYVHLLLHPVTSWDIPPLPLIVKKLTHLKQLKFCPPELDFSESRYVCLQRYAGITELTGSYFKNADTVIISDCNGIDLREAEIGVTVKQLEMVMSRNRCVLLPEFIQPGLRTLRITVNKSCFGDVKMLDISRWKVDGLKILEIESNGPQQVSVGQSIYNIDSLKELWLSCNALDLSGAVINRWTNLYLLHLQDFRGLISLQNTEQLQILDLFVTSISNGREIVLSNSVVDDVKLIKLSSCLKGELPNINLVFPKAVKRLGHISIDRSKGTISLPKYVAGDIDKIELMKCSGQITLPVTACGIIGEIDIQSCFPEVHIELSEDVIKHTKVLTLSCTKIRMPELTHTCASDMEELNVTCSGSNISFRGWALPKLKKIKYCGRHHPTFMLELPSVDQMPSLRRSGVLETDEWFGKVRVENRNLPLTKPEFVELLPH